jgi:hypothetical protein
MTHNLILLYQGRVRAGGTLEEIRSLLSRYPHKILVRSERARPLARALLELEDVVGVRVEKGNEVHVETFDPDALYDRLPALVLDENLPVEALQAEDASMDAIFEYLAS